MGNIGYILDVLYIIRNMEKYHNYLENNRVTKINYKNTVLRSRIFCTLIHNESRQRTKAPLGYLRENNKHKHFHTSKDNGRFTTAQPSPSTEISFTTGNDITSPVLQAKVIQQCILVPSYHMSICTGSPIPDPIDCGNNRL